MSSDFDEALAKLEARQQAAVQKRLAEQQETKRRNQLARSIAEPYLRKLAPSVHEKLLSLRIRLQYVKDSSGQRSVSHPGGFWPLDYTTDGANFGYSPTGLSLTEDGYFTIDTHLPGPAGFETMMSEIQMVDLATMGTTPPDVPVVVDSRSQRLYFTERDYDGFTAHELAPYIAGKIMQMRTLKFLREAPTGQEAEESQRLARSIAEPYLEALAPSIRQKLLDLRIPLIEPTEESGKGWINKLLGQRLRFWRLGDVSLYLSEDGYFATDPGLSGRRGFEAMMSHIRMVEQPNMHPFPRHGEVFVEPVTKSVLIGVSLPTASLKSNYRSFELNTYLADVIEKLHKREVYLRAEKARRR
jgi:hypothetical protein